ncbi:hypothetical protein cd3_105 [Carnobacterium phage cd3]|nr:hypothetical protein cd3_105 [Carnobacterium phage cd3]
MFKTFMKYVTFVFLTRPLAGLVSIGATEINTAQWWLNFGIFILYATPMLVVLNKLFEKGEK